MTIVRLIQSLALLFLFIGAVTSEHTSNWAVLVSTSRFWFNYRHLANVLSLYRTVKRLGIPDSQIILMLPDDMACNPRNAFPGTVYSNADRAVDLYGDNIEVDYRGYEVTVENFIRLLTDRLDEDVPRSKRLGSDAGSNVLVYMTGHGGDQFLKFQDAEEIGAWDLADAFGQMWEKKRYHELLFMIDTCQANTMYTHFYSPNIVATGSSELDQSSYSHHADNDVGVAVIDRWTYYVLEFLETQVTSANSKLNLGDLFDSYDESKIHSQPGVRWDLFPGGEPEGRLRTVVISSAMCRTLRSRTPMLPSQALLRKTWLRSRDWLRNGRSVTRNTLPFLAMRLNGMARTSPPSLCTWLGRKQGPLEWPRTAAGVSAWSVFLWWVLVLLSGSLDRFLAVQPSGATLMIFS